MDNVAKNIDVANASSPPHDFVDISNYQVDIQTKMIQGITGGAKIGTLRQIIQRTDANGQPELFVILATPTERGNVCRIGRSDAALSGWHSTAIDTMVDQLALAPADAGVQRLFAVRNNLQDNKIEVFEISSAGTDTFQVHHLCDVSGSFPMGPAAIGKPANPTEFPLKTGQSDAGPILSIATNSSFYIINPADGETIDTGMLHVFPDHTTVLVGKLPWPNFGAVVFPIVLLSSLPPTFLICTKGNSNAAYTFTRYPMGTPSTGDGYMAPASININQNGDSIDVYAVIKGTNYVPSDLQYFGPLQFWKLTQTGGGLAPGNPPIWGAWTRIPASFLSDEAETLGTNLTVVNEGGGRTTLYLLSYKGPITPQSPIPRSPFTLMTASFENDRWSHWLPLCASTSEGAYAMGSGMAGTGQLFIGNEHGLFQFYRDNAGPTHPQDSTHIWNVREIELSGGDASQMQFSQPTMYRTCYTILDERGAPAVGVDVVLSASDFMQARVNGQSTLLQPGLSLPTTTNALGQVAVDYALSNQISAPSLEFALDSGDALLLLPDREAQQFLANLQPGQLTDEVLPEGKRSQQARDSVAEAVRRTMAAAEQQYREQFVAGIPLRPGCDKRGIRLASADRRPQGLDPALMPPQGWRFSMATGHPVFEEISPAQFAETKQKAAAARQQLEARFGSDFFWDDIVDFFEDAAESVEEGFGNVVEVVVRGADIVVTFVVEGVTLVIDGAIEFAADAFEVVTVIFNAIGTVVGKVILWILKLIGVLPDWERIVALKNSLKRAAAQFCATSAQSYSNLASRRAEIDSYIDHMAGQFAASLTALRGSPMGQKTANSLYGDLLPAGTTIESAVFDLDGVSVWNAGTWLIDELLDALLSRLLPGPQGFSQFGAALGSLDSFFASAEGSIERRLFEPAATILAPYIDNPATLLQLSLADLLALFAQVVQEWAKVAKELVAGMLQAAQAFVNDLNDLPRWLDAGIDIPFFSALYEEVIGGNPSLMDLACLIIAVPAALTDGVTDVVDEEMAMLAAVSATAARVVTPLAMSIGGVGGVAVDALDSARYKQLCKAVSLVSFGVTVGISEGKCFKTPVEVFCVPVTVLNGLMAATMIAIWKRPDNKSAYNTLFRAGQVLTGAGGIAFGAIPKLVTTGSDKERVFAIMALLNGMLNIIEGVMRLDESRIPEKKIPQKLLKVKAFVNILALPALRAVADALPGPVEPPRTVVIQTSRTFYLTAVDNGGVAATSGTVISTNARSVGANAKFTLVPIDEANQTYAIRTADGHYVTAVQGGGLGSVGAIHTDQRTPGPWEKFIIDDLGDGTCSLRTTSNYYLTADGSNSGPDYSLWPLHTNETTRGTFETFRLLPV